MTGILLTLLFTNVVAGFTLSSIHKKADSRLFSSPSLNLPEGLRKTISREGNGDFVKIGDIATVKYSCYLPESPPFARSDRQKVVRFYFIFFHGG